MKQEGEKLTGATVRNENETAIQDGKVTGNEVAFTVVREREGRESAEQGCCKDVTEFHGVASMEMSA